MQMDNDYIEKFDVIRRYHQNRLNDDELSSFEIYIIENPEMINVIEKEKLIHDAFKEHEPLLKESSGSVASTPWIKGLAMAACLVVAVVVVFYNTGSSTPYSLQPPVILETFRGAGDSVIQLSGEPIVQFQVDMGPAEFLPSNAFTAELVSAEGDIAYRSSGLTADTDGWLIYPLVDQDVTLSGAFQVRVYPDGQPGQATAYPVFFTLP